jgi:hypothetical protein
MIAISIRSIPRIPNSVLALLVATHLCQVETDLMEAERAMLHRFRTMAVRLPTGDPDRALLEVCIEALAMSIRRQEGRRTPPTLTREEPELPQSMSRPATTRHGPLSETG